MIKIIAFINSKDGGKIIKEFNSKSFDLLKIKQYISYEYEVIAKLLSEQISKLDKKISDLQLIRRSVCEFIKGLSRYI